MRHGIATLCLIRDLHRAISDFEIRFNTCYGLCLNEGMLLCTLNKSGDMTAGELSESLGLSFSNTSKIIASAEKKGFVNRKLGDNDKRQMHFVLSEAGKRKYEEISKCQLELPEALSNLIR